MIEGDNMEKKYKVFVSVNYFDSVIHVRISKLPPNEKALNDIARIVESYVNEKIGLYLTMHDMGLIK